MGWVNHAVRHDGVLEELLRLAHLVGPAQFHRVAKAVQKPEAAGFSTSYWAVVYKQPETCLCHTLSCH